MSRTVPALCVALLAAAIFTPSYAWLQAPTSPPIVASVDLERVFNDIDRRRDLEAELEAELKGYQDRADSMRQKAERLRQDLELLVPGTKKYEEKQKEAIEAAVDYRALAEFSNAKLDSVRADARRLLFDEIVQAAAAYAETNGIDFILADDSAISLQQGTDIQIVQQLAMKRLVYANARYDITDGLIAWMNER